MKGQTKFGIQSLRDKQIGDLMPLEVDSTGEIAGVAPDHSSIRELFEDGIFNLCAQR